MSYLLSRNEHFSQQESSAIQRDMSHGLYNGFRNTFDEWEQAKERAADAPQTEESPEDEIEQRRRYL